MSAMHEDEAQRDFFAGRVEQATRDDEGEVRIEERLVVVAARDRWDARRESGLIEVDFAPATDAEMEEWDTICSEPLTEADLHNLLSHVRRQQVALGNRRARDSTFGGEQVTRRRERARYKAEKLCQLRGKLELKLDALLEGGADDEEATDG
jgi:hypothetical protein